MRTLFIFLLEFKILQLFFHTFLTQVIRLSHKHYLDVIENALSDGSAVLLENIGETVCMIEFQRLPRVEIAEHEECFNDSLEHS